MRHMIWSFVVLFCTGTIAGSVSLGCPVPFLRETLMSIVITVGVACLILPSFHQVLAEVNHAAAKRARRTQLMHQPETGSSQPVESTPDMPPMAEPAPEPVAASPYAIYLDAYRQLWKLRINGEDETELAEYLRNVMAECYSQLDAAQQETIEREAADAWKHI